MSKLKVNEIEAYNDPDGVTIVSEFTFSEDATFNKDVTVKGNLILGDMNTDTVEFVADVNSHFLPEESSSWNIGSAAKKWNDIWLSGSADIAGTGNITTLVAGTGQITGDFRVDGPTVGSDYLRVKSDTGRVGLGTNSPSYDLELARAADVQTDFVITGESNVFAALGKTAAADGRLRIWSLGDSGGTPTCALNASSGLNSWVNNGGNFGIGTSSPTVELEVVGTAKATDAAITNNLTVSNHASIGATATTYPLLIETDKDSLPGNMALLVKNTDSNTSTNIGLNASSGQNTNIRFQEDEVVKWSVGVNAANGDFRFRDNGNIGRVLITQDGNVGIGAPVPVHALHLNSPDGEAKHVSVSSGNSGDPRVLLGKGTENHGRLSLWSNADAGSTASCVIQSDPAENSWINNGGNLGIGLTNPTELLHVNGNTIIEGDLTVNGTTTTVNSAEITVDDPNITLNAVDTPTDVLAHGGGITLSGTTAKTITWANDTDRWHFNQGLQVDAGAGDIILVDGSLGIGTDVPSRPLNIQTAQNEVVRLDNTASGGDCAINYRTSYDVTDTNWATGIDGDDGSFRVSNHTNVGTNDRLVIDSSGRVGIGDDVAGSSVTPEQMLHVQNGSVAIMSNENTATAENMNFYKSRHALAGGHTAVQGADGLGAMQWFGSDGDEWLEAASIGVKVNQAGTVPNDEMPGKLIFSTRNTGDVEPQLRMVIDKAGYVGIGVGVPTELLHVNGDVLIAGTIGSVTDPVAAQDAATKNYVDTTIASAVTAEDLDFQGDAGGALSIDLDSEVLTFVGGDGVTTTGAGNTLTIDTDADQGHVTNVGTLADLDVTGDLSVDTDTLYVLAGSGVGINTPAPTSSLGVNGSVALAVSTVSSFGLTSFNATASDYTILGDTAGVGNDITVNLPNPALCSGRLYNIKKISGVHDVIINPTSGLIDGAATKTISATWVSITIQSNGTNWFII